MNKPRPTLAVPPASPEDDGQRLTPGELARRLRVTPGTLRRWRVDGTGPKFIKLGNAGGRIIYRQCDVVAWESGHAANSTSEKAAK